MGTVSNVLAAHPDAIWFHNPELALAGVGLEDLQKWTQETKNFRDTLPGKAQHDEARIVCGPVCSNVGEIRIQRAENAAFALTYRGDFGVRVPTKQLIGHNCDVVTSISQQRCGLRWKVLVGLESHVLTF